MTKYIVFILMAGCSACAPKAKVPTLEFHGAANRFAQTEAKAFGGIAAIENSMVVVNGEVVYYYDPNYDATMVKHDSSGSQLVMRSDARFSYVLEHQGTLYAFVTRGGTVHLLTSADGVQWTEQGVVVPAQPYYQWNVGVAVDDAGVWHMLVEAGSAPDQSDVGLVYMTSVDGRTFQNHGVVVPRGGNPFVTFVRGQGLLVIHGQVFDPYGAFGAEWYTTASTFDGTSWRTHKDRFTLGTPSVHVCDPHAVETPQGLLLTVSVDQNSIYKAEAKGDSFEALYLRLVR